MSQFLFQDEDEINIVEPETNSDLKSDKLWHILIVDDEPAINDVTRLVLNKSVILDRKLALYSAYSAQEAKVL
jgi:hypothetical protein